METEKLEDLTQMKFEVLDGKFRLKNNAEPLSQEQIDFILNSKLKPWEYDFSDDNSSNHTE